VGYLLFYTRPQGIITNFLPPISLALLILLFLRVIDPAQMPAGLETIFEVSVSFNLVCLVTRYVIRVIACRQVYGFLDLIGVALRWPVALYINMTAVYRAWKTYLGESAFASKPIVWSKSTHELPEDFMTATR
jgi:adsorption protein B